MTTKKPALVLVHGFRGSPDGVRDLAKILKSKYGYDVYVPHMPPSGKTTIKSYTPKHYADFLREYIKKHNLKRPVIVGHSMGSIIASAIAEYYPEDINEKLILMAPVSTRPYRFITNLQPLVAFLPNYVCSWVSTRYLFVPRNHKLYKETLRLVNICGAEYINSKAVREAARFSTSYAIYDFNFKNSTLLIVGNKDRLIPLDKTQKLAKDKAFKIEIIKNTGHLLNYECPSKVAKIIADFLI